MRTVVIYKEESEHSRDVETFLTDFLRQTGRNLEVLDPETKEGESFCRAYDIVQYPTVIALAEDGKMLSLWPGVPLPTISEVSYYG